MWFYVESVLSATWMHLNRCHKTESTSMEPQASQSIQAIIGKRIKCTLDDGRVAKGEFVCLDRL